MASELVKRSAKIAGLGLLALLAACQPPPPPPAPAPPPPPPPTPVVVQEVIPVRPLPPNGAQYVLQLPTRADDGSWVTINSKLDSDETIWHLRSAWNVAALNCLGTQYQPILDGYSAFLKKYSRSLTKANAAIDARYRKQYGSRIAAIKAREAHMTQVYNYFAMPPTISHMCSAALAVASDAAAAQGNDLSAFAASALPRFEAVYDKFFGDYAQYQADSAAWDAKYGAEYGASQPGYVAVHGAAGPSIATTLTATQGDMPVGAVTDPETGVRVPVVPAASQVSTPVVQPIPQGSGQ